MGCSSIGRNSSLDRIPLMSWHKEYFEEMGWYEELRRRKIANGVICGRCGEWPEYCACEDCSCCNASVSGKCLAVTHNVPYCEPECCGKMDGREEEGNVQ